MALPRVGHLWYQIILNTRCTWLPGDRRGFRSKGGVIRSSGDYKHPPPQDEHAGLRRFHQNRSGPPVRILRHYFPVIARTLIQKIHSQGYRLLAVSVDAVHVHLLVERPDDRKQVKRVVGTWKQAASHAVRAEMPGRIWAQGCNPEPMEDRRHQQNTFAYILRHAARDAFTWRFEHDASN